MELASIVEALLIASEEPLKTSELSRLIRAQVAEKQEFIDDENSKLEETEDPIEIDPEILKFKAVADCDIIEAITELNTAYDTNNRSFTLLERAKGWKLFTKPDYADYVRQLFPAQKPKRLTSTAMETLAIIAYRQPITKAAMEAVRGVSCDGMVQKLLDLELVRIQGRADLPGRPLLYETTDLFYEHFGIKTIDDLPNSTELRSVKLPEPEKNSENPEAKEEQLPLTSEASETSEPSNTSD